MLFIRSGAIIPTEEPKQYEDNMNTANIILNLYPAGKSEYTLYEDDGVTFDYEQGERAATRFEMVDNDDRCTITIGDRIGSFKGMTEHRTYSANVRLSKAPATVKVDGADVAFTYADNFAKFEIGEGKVVDIVYGN